MESQKRRRCAAMLRQHAPARFIFRRDIAPFGQQRVIIVAGHKWAVRFVLIRPGGETKVCPAVKHVDVHRRPGIEHRVQLAHRFFRVAMRVFAAPRVEPAHPELHANQRPIGLNLAQCLKPRRRVRSEIRRAQLSVHAAIGDGQFLKRAVRSEQRHVDPTAAHPIAQMCQVSSIIAVIPVLILDLHRDDRPAARALKRREPGQQHVEPFIDMFQKRRMRTSHLHPIFGEQPPRQPAEIPLGADVRPGPDDGEQSQLVRSASNRSRSSMPSNANRPLYGSCAFHGTYVSTVLHPSAFSFKSRSRQ